MQTGQHIEVCQRFLDDALALDSRGSHMAAAEMIWGATVQALEALGHIRDGNTIVDIHLYRITLQKHGKFRRLVALSAHLLLSIA